MEVTLVRNTAWLRPNNVMVEEGMVVMRQRLATHDNGGRPFIVEVIGNIVNLYNNYAEPEEFLERFVCQKVFVGKSPKNEMTEYSGGYGDEFDGNTMLLQINPNKYIYIGGCEGVTSFETQAEIIEYYSPVGNSDVPYAYAIDSAGQYVLPEEHICLSIPAEYSADPHEYYYKQLKIPGIKCVVGNEKYNLGYSTGDLSANYDRLCDRKFGIEFELQSGEIIEVSKEMYINTIERFGQEKGLHNLKYTELYDRSGRPIKQKIADEESR